MADGYSVYVDFANDGSFATAGDDISADFIGATIDRGFAGLLDRVAKVGRCTLVLKNQNKQYSPYLVANALPRRPVKLDMTYSGTTVTKFRGFVESWSPTAGTKGDRRVTVECVDAIALLQLHDSAIALQQNKRPDQMVSTVVAECYTPPSTAYDVDPDTYPYGADNWTDDVIYGSTRQRALASLKDICTSAWGRFYIRQDGAAVYESRHHRLLDTVSKATLSGTMSALHYRKGVFTVYNDVRVTAHPRQIGYGGDIAAIEELWRNEGTAPPIEPGETRLFRASFRDPNNPSFRIGGLSVVSPVATTDYRASTQAQDAVYATRGDSGETVLVVPAQSGVDHTADLTVTSTVYANSADISVTNNHTQRVYLTLIRIRGVAVRIYNPPTFIKTDATSQAAYQKRTLPINAVLQDKPGEAEVQAQYLLKYKDPLDDIAGVGFYAQRSATFQGYARDLEVGDRITITEAQTGPSSLQVFINSIRHTIAGKTHRVEVDAEKNEDVSGAPFILDTSLLGTGVLVY